MYLSPWCGPLVVIWSHRAGTLSENSFLHFGAREMCGMDNGKEGLRGGEYLLELVTKKKQVSRNKRFFLLFFLQV